MPLQTDYFRLLSVRNRILLFAVLVTLLPSIGLGWAYFSQTAKALLESSQRELLGTVGQVRREFDLWFKERYYDIRVFSNSYLLSEGLENYLSMRSKEAGKGATDDRAQLAKVQSYLSLVHSQFTDYARLLVFDRDGELLAQSPELADSANLPADWPDQLDTKKIIVGELYGSERGMPFILAAVPILSADGAILGFLAAEIKLDALTAIMTSLLAGNDLQTGSAELLLVGGDGRILLSTKDAQSLPHGNLVHTGGLSPDELGAYLNVRGVPVVGILSPISGFTWRLVMEKPQDQVFSEIIKLRTRTLVGVGVLVMLIGLFAYLLSRGIISPLERLTEAAGKVADGDLEVNVPVKRDDELGRATQVFNDMVSQLRQSRERLEQLSTIDSLTKLANRRHILAELTTHLERFHRSGSPFSVLLVDADHFKHINDTAGHVVGDKVLRQMGAIFRDLLRTVDTAGRYGGEEFLIILEGTRGKDALLTAERIRLAIASSETVVEDATIKFTVSIGVAEISAGEDEDQLVMRADSALYQAKHEGRNRSILSALPQTKVTQLPTVRKPNPS